MTHFQLGTVGQNLIPDFVLTNGWSTSGSWNSTSSGVLDPANNTGRASLNLGYTGPFQIRWGHSQVAAATTGLSIGIVPSANHPYLVGSFYVSSPDIRWFVESGETNTTQWRDNQSVLLSSSPKPTTLQTFQISRDDSNIIRLHRDGTLLYTGAAFSGAICLTASANSSLTKINNLQTREFYSSDWDA